MITLGNRSFAGPYMTPLWSPPKGAGLYAVMAPGWRLLTFRALDFAQAADLAEPPDQLVVLRDRRGQDHAEQLLVQHDVADVVVESG